MHNLKPETFYTVCTLSVAVPIDRASAPDALNVWLINAVQDGTIADYTLHAGQLNQPHITGETVSEGEPFEQVENILARAVGWCVFGGDDELLFTGSQFNAEQALCRVINRGDEQAYITAPE